MSLALEMCFGMPLFIGYVVSSLVVIPLVTPGITFISLKPLAERKVTTARVVDRLREKLAAVTGLKVFMVPAQDLRVGARQSKAQYQFTLWGTDVDELQSWMPKVLEAARKLPGLTDVSTDREQGGLQADVTIDRLAASRLCVQIQDIDNALNDIAKRNCISKAEAMKRAGLSPALVYAFEQTGLLVTEDNQHLIPEQDLRAWQAAVARYHAQQAPA